MKKCYFIFRLAIALIFILPTMVTAQIWTEDFDGSNPTNPFAFPCVIDDSRDYLGIVCLDGGPCGNDDINSDYTPGYLGVTGSFFGARDINGDPCGTAESDTPAREGSDTWDGNQNPPTSDTFVTFSVSIDGGTSANVISFAAVGNNNTGPAVDLGCDGSGDGALITSTFTQYCSQLPMVGSSLDLSITIGGMNTDGDDVAIDNIEIFCGTPPSGAIIPSCTPFVNPGALFSEDFDGLNGGNPFSFPCVIDDSRDYFGIVCLDGGPCGSDDINSDYTSGYSGVTGNFFGARDINGDPCGTEDPVTSTAPGIDISSCGGRK